MESDKNPLDIFFQKLPMSTALFDQQLVLRRFNPRWIEYIENYSHVDVVTGTHIYELLPGIQSTIQPYIDRALGGQISTADGLRLDSSDNVLYWDASFVPWVSNDNITGFLLVVADVTERILSRQILERKVVDRTQKLSALYDVMTIAAQPLELTEKLNQSLERVIAAVHAQAGAIQLLDSRAEYLHLVAHHGFTSTVTNELMVVPANIGLTGWITREQEPLAVADIFNDQRTSDLVRNAGFRAYVGVPMTARGGILGILSGFREIRRPFSREDVSLLDSVADQIGTAIENARLRQENEQLLIVEERNRLARELHDAVTQSLYSLALYAETSLRFSKANESDMAITYMNQVADTAQQALREMRILLHNLRPAVLEQVGLIDALKQRLDAVEKRLGISVDYQVDGDIDLPANVEEALYQIAQEALNNAAKHSAATQIKLELRQRGAEVELIVFDNGRGFRIPVEGDSGGLGLTSMRERIDSLGGNLDINTRIGGGSKVHVKLNLDRADESSDSVKALQLN